MKSGLSNSILILFLSAVYIAFVIAGGNHLCYFKTTFGIPCPGCGLTRSLVSLFSGDIYSAFYFHPLFPAVIFIVILALLQKADILTGIWKSSMFWVIIIVLFVAVYIVRMILFFPDAEPMTLNRSSVLFRIIGYIGNIM